MKTYHYLLLFILSAWFASCTSGAEVDRDDIITISTDSSRTINEVLKSKDIVVKTAAVVIRTICVALP